MGLNCGIVGLPNVGKSTIFQALTAKPAESANYPFSTIEPNKGIALLNDPRLQRIADIMGSQEIIPTAVEFVDIAGIVRDASQGAGLGNRFLAHIREVDLIVHVVRCFDDPDVIHVEDRVDPLSDIETINLELAIADLQTVERRLERIGKERTSHDRTRARHAQHMYGYLCQLHDCLAAGRAVGTIEEPDDDLQALISELNLLTAKRQLLLCNVGEEVMGNDYSAAVQSSLEDDSSIVIISGKLEAEIVEIDSLAERAEFMQSIGLESTGLERLARRAYDMLSLRTFFTAGPRETRAWTFRDGDKAVRAASYIHSDMERGFICAEVYSCADLFEAGSEATVRERGKIRKEGRNYRMQDGDIVFIRFNI